MADRVDPSAYAYDIDSSLKRRKSLACDESPYLNFRGFWEKGHPPVAFILRRICYTSCGSLTS